MFGFIVCTVAATLCLSSGLPPWPGCCERITFSSLLAWPERGPGLKLETWARSAASLDPSLFVASGGGASPPPGLESKTNFCVWGPVLR